MVIVGIPPRWRSDKERPRKPIRVKGGRTWTCHVGGALTVYNTRGEKIRSLADGEWTDVRLG